MLFGAMLYLIGLGLGDIKDITVKGLEIVKQCDKVMSHPKTNSFDTIPTNIAGVPGALHEYPDRGPGGITKILWQRNYLSRQRAGGARSRTARSHVNLF